MKTCISGEVEVVRLEMDLRFGFISSFFFSSCKGYCRVRFLSAFVQWEEIIGEGFELRLIMVTASKLDCRIEADVSFNFFRRCADTCGDGVAETESANV